MILHIFHDRKEAGKLLAEILVAKSHQPHLLILAIPRGGVPVAYEVAKELHAPLDVFIVRKLGVPGHEEFAMGAISNCGTQIIDEDIIKALNITNKQIEEVAQAESIEIQRRESVYRENLPPLDIKNKNLIIIDDGLATGSTMLAALRSLRIRKPAFITVAIPVAPSLTRDEIAAEADDMICLACPEPFYGVGQWYLDFSQVTDKEVLRMLKDVKKLAGPIKNKSRAS